MQDGAPQANGDHDRMPAGWYIMPMAVLGLAFWGLVVWWLVNLIKPYSF